MFARHTLTQAGGAPQAGLLAGVVLVATLAVAAQAPSPVLGELFGHAITVGPDGQPLRVAGVRVTLASKTEPTLSFETQTDATGAYAFKNVPVGDYLLTATGREYEEFKREVRVVAGTRSEVILELRLKAVREEVTVTGEAPGIRPQQTMPKSELQQQTLQNAPLVSEQFQDALPLLPGVVRGADGLLNIKGAQSTQAGWLVNSANVADSVTGEQAINLPIDVIQEVEVLPNPYSAEYGKFAGAVTTIETKPAKSNFEFSLQNFLPRLRRRNGALRGVESATPRVTFTGPILKDRLAFLQSFEYRFVRTPVTSLPALARDQELESFDSFTQLDATINPNHLLSVVVSLYPQKNRFATLSTFNPQEATANYRQRGWFAGLRDHFIFSNQAVLESAFSIKDFDVRIFPAQGGTGEPFVLRPERNFGEFFNTQARNTRRYEWIEVYHLPQLTWHGAHYWKLGLNLTHHSFDGYHASRPVRVERGDTTLAELIEFFGPTAIARNKFEFTFFAQDRWNLTRRLTLDLGLRFDRDSLADENLLAPRLGLAYLLTADNKTVLRAGIGLFYDKVPLNVGYFEQLQQRVVTRFAPDGLTVIDGPRIYVNHLAGGRLRTPRSLAFNLEVDRELTRQWLVRFSYQERQGRREYILQPFADLAGVPTLLLSASGRSRYREFQLAATYRFRESDFLNASYVRAQATGNLNRFQQFFGNFEDPVIRPDEHSLLSSDVPNRFLLWGEVTLPFKIILAPVLEIRDGFPFSLIDAERNFLGPRNRAGRFPLFAALDAQLFRDFKVKAFGKARSFRVGIKFFNLLRHFNPRDFQNNVDALDAGTFYNSRGKLIRGKLSLTF